MSPRNGEPLRQQKWILGSQWLVSIQQRCSCRQVPGEGAEGGRRGLGSGPPDSWALEQAPHTDRPPVTVLTLKSGAAGGTRPQAGDRSLLSSTLYLKGPEN